MKLWNGLHPTMPRPKMQYTPLQPLWIDDGGTVWYMDGDGAKHIWCTSDRLFRRICCLYWQGQGVNL